MVGYNNTAFKGRYFHSGSGFISDALSQVIPLLKNYSRKKLRDFAGNLATELDQGGGIRKSLKSSAGTTARSVLKDLTGGRPRKSYRERQKRQQQKRKQRGGPSLLNRKRENILRGQRLTSLVKSKWRPIMNVRTRGVLPV
jgi:hypothetical protein